MIGHAGAYVARAFEDDGYQLLVESDAFSNGASGVTTDESSYVIGASITVSWSGLAGSANDWIALAPQGSSPITVLRYAYTGGATTGSHTFSGLVAPGSYVARTFPNDSYALAGESTAFTVSGVSVTTDRPAYPSTGTVVVSWSGLAGTATDWVAIAPAGSPATDVTRWSYTGGATSGAVSFTAPSINGQYVARALPSNSYSIAGESAAFTSGVAVTTDLVGYDVGQAIVVNWELLPGNALDWIALAPQGSPATTVLAWIYAPGASGSHTFLGLAAAGTYVARAFVDDSYTLLSESRAVSVGQGAPPPAGSTTVTTSIVGWGQDIAVSWAGFPGSATDWLSLAPVGSSDATTTRWVYTGGAIAGSFTFVGGVPAAGSYVARGFANDTLNRVAQSAPFTVQHACVSDGVVPPSTIRTDADVAAYRNFTGVGNHIAISIAPANSGLSVTLPCLQAATTIVVIEGWASGPQKALDALSAPRLTTLDGGLDLATTSVVSLPALTTLLDLTSRLVIPLDLPSLVSAANIRLSQTPAFTAPNLAIATSLDVVSPGLSGTTLDFGGVTTIPGNVRIATNAPSFGLPALTAIGGNAVFSGNAHMVGLEHLTTVAGALDITAPTDTAALTNLRSVGGDFHIRAEEILLPALQSVYSLFSNGTGGQMPLLRTLHVPMLTSIYHTLQIQSNPQLSACQVDGLIAQLAPPPLLISVSQNGGGSCPP